jgi:hypothetical protein
VVYTESMDINLADIFNLVAVVIEKRKPEIHGTLPTLDDLQADLEKLWESQTPVTVPEASYRLARVENGAQRSTAVATGCVPCSIGHLGTCTGLLNEAMRFARSDGVGSEEVINRVNVCLDELNALERMDLRPEMTHGLPDWEKALAEQALDLSRRTRHDLEGLTSVSDLEAIAAKTQGGRQEIGKAWFRERIKRLSPEQRQVVEEKIQQKFSLDQAKKVAAAAAANEVEQRWNSPETK